MRTSTCSFSVLAWGLLVATLQAEERPPSLTDAAARVHLGELCTKCHGAKKTKGKIRLDGDPAGWKEDHWHKIVLALQHVDMPPVEEKQPSRELRAQLEQWAQGHLDRHALKRAGDPGAVPWRRLTAIELDHMIRDLTGHEMNASKHFPVENFGGEGFSNLAAVQNALSGPVLDKYLAMAEEVTQHARFDQAGALVFDPPGAIQAPEVRRDRALSDIKLMARQACGELYLDPGKLIGGEGDERSLDGAFKKAAKEWTGPQAYLEALWLSRAAEDPHAALPEIAIRQELNLAYLRYLHHLENSCPAGSLEELHWVAPLRSLPAPKSVTQEVPDEVQAACRGIASGIWSCAQRATNDGPTRTPSQPYRTVGPGQLHVRLTAKTQEMRDKKRVTVMKAPDRLHVVVDLLHPAEDTVVYCGLPTLHLKEPDRDVFEEINGKRVKKGRKKGETRQVLLARSSLATVPTGARWGEYSFSKDQPSPALILTKSATLVFDLGAVAAKLNPDGGNLDAFLPLARSAEGGLVHVRHSGNGQIPLADLRWLTADGSIGRWLIGNKTQEERLLADWESLFARWFPPHPLTIAPFDGSRRSNGLPDEVQFIRDDARLKAQLLDDAGRQRMDDLWATLDMLANEPRQRLDIFVGKYRLTGLEEAPQVSALEDRQANLDQDKDERSLQQRMKHPYGSIPVTLPERLVFYRRQLAEQRALWRERVLEAATSFAEKAWRRPLSEKERARFERHYDAIVEKANLDVEETLRTLLMRALVSPHFLFRCERVSPGGRETPLDAWELATRLSLFLWASLPDAELRRCAADGSLLEDEVIRQQVRRMMADPRSTGLAEHFFGQWLGFAGFDRGASDPDREAFPEFTPEVRRAMQGEALAFFEDLIRNDRDVRLIVNADYSFLNTELKRYYGLALEKATDTAEGFQRTPMTSAERGGVLGMGAILVRNSRTQRTSPTNRGVWVVENLMGMHLPPPPADVPVIPDRAEEDAGLSLRQQMLKHREDPSCASCHARIDPYGFAFESFDAAGRLRSAEARRDIEYETTRDGVRLDGLAALRRYLGERSGRLQRNLVRRMLGYALNRPVAVSDLPLIDRTLHDLAKNDHRLATIVENIALSRQFRFHRAANERELTQQP